MSISYRNLVKQSLIIIWKYKFLWVFGIFAALFNTFEIFKFLNPNLARNQALKFWLFLKSNFSYNVISQLANKSILYFILLILFILLSAAVVIFFIWLAIRSQVSLIQTVKNIYDGKKVSFKNSFIIGKGQFYKLLVLNIGSKFLISILGFLMLLPNILAMYFIKNKFSSLFFQGFSFILSIFLLLAAFFIYFIVLYSIIYIVLYKKDLIYSIKKGYSLFSNNFLISFEVMFLLFIITFVVSIVSGLFLKILMVFLLVLFSLSKSWLGYIISIFLSFIVLCLLLTLIGAFTSFQFTLWSLLFFRLTENKYIGFLKRLFSSFQRKSS